MNGQQHYREAERLLEQVKASMVEIREGLVTEDLSDAEAAVLSQHSGVMAAVAQTHAMLALADSQTSPVTGAVDPSTGGELQTIGRDS